MKAYVFPGQGSQFPGMGKAIYENSTEAQELFHQANEILGFDITDIMFNGSEDDIKETRVTQPAIFIHSVVMAHLMGKEFNPSMVAGHSLGEFSALVAAGVLNFEKGLNLVAKRANAMQAATEKAKGAMAAIIGMEDVAVEEVCHDIDGVVVPANYNCPGQLVISGEINAVKAACEELTKQGARRAMLLPVGGAFHSPLMEPARTDLAAAIEATEFKSPICPVYQNVTALPVKEPNEIKNNLIAQLTAPVRWTQTMKNMISDGCDEVVEVGPGKVLQGLFKKVDRQFNVSSADI